MRLQRGVPVAGVDPETARCIARACHDRWSTVEQIAGFTKLRHDSVRPLLEQLVQGGFLQVRAHPFGSDGWEWNTTLAGGALTMATFLKPITRAKADVMLSGVLERASTYNADDSKPYLIDAISVFGSYLRPEVATLGDLDLALTVTARRPGSDSPDALLEYAYASARRFNTFVDQLAWGQTEIKQLLRARSGYINVHTEDITRFTQDSRLVFDGRNPSRTAPTREPTSTSDGAT